MQESTVSSEIAREVNARALADRWWTLLLRGLAGVAFGVISLLVPGITLIALVLMFGVYAILDGVFNLVHAGRAGHGRRWGSFVFEGVVSMLAGLAAFLWPGITAIVLVLIVATWALVHGIFE